MANELEDIVVVVSAEKLREDLYQQMEALAASEFSLARRYVCFGKALLQFKQQECWRALGYVTFNAFITELVTKWGRKRTQIYAYLSVVEVLLPTIPAAQLEEMGISKAMELKYALEKQQKTKSGAVIPEEIIAAALRKQTTGKELRAMIGEAFCQKDDREPGTWYDWGGSYLTPNEKKLFTDAARVTIVLLGIQKSTPEHIQRKAIFLAWAEEFYGTHAASVYGDVDASSSAPVLVQSGQNAGAGAKG